MRARGNLCRRHSPHPARLRSLTRATAGDPPPPGEGVKKSRSRDASERPRFAASHCKKALPTSSASFRMILPENRNGTFRDHAQEGRGAPNGAPTGSASRRKQMLFAITARLPERGRRSPFGAPLRLSRRGFASTRLRAALPGTTGCKRENPPRHQCSKHLAVRTRAGRADAPSRLLAKRQTPPAGTAPAPPIGCHRSTPFDGRDETLYSDIGDHCHITSP